MIRIRTNETLKSRRPTQNNYTCIANAQVTGIGVVGRICIGSLPLQSVTSDELMMH